MTPLGADDPTPILSWQLKSNLRGVTQRKYQIVVASSAGKARDGRGDVWDSGAVSSDSTAVRYAGKTLKARTRYYWSVRSYTPGRTDWAPVSWFETAYLSPSDWQGAWIAGPLRGIQGFPTAAQGAADDTCCLQTNTTLADASAIGSTNLKVANVGGFNPGGVVTIDTGANQETATVATVGTAPAGNTTLVAPGSAGDTTARVASMTGYTVGAPLKIDTGAGQESATINAVGTAAGAPTSLAAPVSPGDTNVQVNSTAGFAVGQPLGLDTGASFEGALVSNVGTVTRSTSLFGPVAAGDTNLLVTSVAGLNVGDVLHVDPGANQDTVRISALGTAGTNSTVASTSVTSGPPAAPSYTGVSWVWNTAGAATSAPSGAIYVRKTFTVADPSTITNAWLRINVDDSHIAYVNGTQVASSSGANAWQTSQYVNIKPQLVAGTNVVAVQATNGGGAGSMIAAIRLDDTTIGTDTTWKSLPGAGITPPVDWNTAGFDDSAWPGMFISGAYPLAPWNTLADPAVASPSNLKVASTTGFVVGDTIAIDTGANLETRTLTAVGTGGAAGGGLTLDSPMAIVHSVNAVVRDISKPGTGLTVTPALAKVHDALVSVIAPGTGITFSPALSLAHPAGTTTRGLGSGISFTPALSAAHAIGVVVSSLGTGLTLSAPLRLAHASGAAVVGPVPADYCKPVTDGTPSGTCKEIRPAPHLRQAFNVEPVSKHGPVMKARVYHTGVGIDDMSVNGALVDPTGVMNPEFTSYNKTVAYLTDDVTSLIKQDKRHATENVIATILGSGRYDQEASPQNHGWPLAEWRGDPTLRADLWITYADGTEQLVKSDDTWKVNAEGPYRYDSDMLGELYDARKTMNGWNTPSYDASSWANARIPAATAIPTGQVVSQRLYRSRILRRFSPTIPVETLAPGNWLWNTGQEMTGAATFKIWGATKGQAIGMYFIERRNDDPSKPGTQDGALGYVPNNMDSTIYISDGTGTETNPEVYTPRFYYGGYQWLEVAGVTRTGTPPGLPDNVHVEVSQFLQEGSVGPDTGTITTSNAQINQTLDIIHNTMKLAHYESIVVDTPTYEKDGWTNDQMVMMPSNSYAFDEQLQIQKTSRDLADDQIVPADLLPHPEWEISPGAKTTPPWYVGETDILSPGNFAYGYQFSNTWPGGSGFGTSTTAATPEWQGEVVAAPWYAYERYGDLAQLARSYGQMTAFLGYEQRYFALDGDSFPCTLNGTLGDWLPPSGGIGGAGVMANSSNDAFFGYLVHLTAQAAHALGNTTDEATYNSLFDCIKTGYNQKYWRGTYYADTATGPLLQAPQIVALMFGMVPNDKKAALQTALADRVMTTDTGHQYTGALTSLGFDPVLTEAAHTGIPKAADAIYSALTTTTYPSYADMEVNNGWTGLGESWEAGSRTRTHEFKGGVYQWAYEGLAGIGTAPGAAYKQIVIKPLITKVGADAYGVTSVAATYNSVRGMIKSSWAMGTHGPTLNVTIPANTTAKVYVPAPNKGAVNEVGTGRSLAADKAPGVTYLGHEQDAEVYQVGSGSYIFRVTEPVSLQPLQDKLTELVTAGRIPASAVSELHDRLTRASDLAAAGDECSAIGYLEQFILLAQKRIKTDAAARDELITLAQGLITALKANNAARTRH